MVDSVGSLIEMADWIESAPTRWLPAAGYVKSFTFTLDEADQVASALRLSAQQREPVVRVEDILDRRIRLEGCRTYEPSIRQMICDYYDNALGYDSEYAKSCAEAFFAVIEIQSSDGGVVADTPSNETATDVMAHPSPMGSRSCDVKTTACGVAGVAPGPSEAIADITAERRRQIEAEGWTPEHDDRHSGGELAAAAAAYAFYNTEAESGQPAAIELFPTNWHPDWWKPKDRRRDLVRAGALIVAEIERLDRVASSGRR